MAGNDYTKDKGWKEVLQRAQAGDKASRDQFFVDNQGLLYMAAKRFVGRGYELEELVQIGAVGLLKAIDKFDILSDYSFSTYAVPVIIGELQRYFRDDSMLHISRSIKDNARKIAAVRTRYRLENKDDLSVSELERITGLNREEILSAMDAYSTVESLDKPIGEELMLQDKLEDKYNLQNEVVSRLTVCKLIEELDDRQSTLIKCRYMDNMTQMQTAEKMGLNQVAVSRLEKKILKNMYCKII